MTKKAKELTKAEKAMKKRAPVEVDYDGIRNGKAKYKKRTRPTPPELFPDVKRTK